MVSGFDPQAGPCGFALGSFGQGGGGGGWEGGARGGMCTGSSTADEDVRRVVDLREPGGGDGLHV